LNLDIQPLNVEVGGDMRRRRNRVRARIRDLEGLEVHGPEEYEEREREIRRLLDLLR